MKAVIVHYQPANPDFENVTRSHDRGRTGQTQSLSEAHTLIRRVHFQYQASRRVHHRECPVRRAYPANLSFKPDRMGDAQILHADLPGLKAIGDCKQRCCAHSLPG
jgi:hypothetical protein